jgi:hypothetical protein
MRSYITPRNIAIFSVVIVFLFMYLNYSFKERFSSHVLTPVQDVSTNVIMVEEPESRPYATTPINGVDDYEYNLVFRGEGDKAMTKATRDFLMSAYPKDWATLPPSSELFQDGLAAFKEKFMNPSPPPKGNPYKEVDGSNMTPPDMDSLDAKEKEILATYVPKKPGELTTYDAADAREIIERIYKAKGLVPSVKESGNNVFTVTTTVPEGKEIEYEEEATYAKACSDAVPTSGENTIEVPIDITPSGPKDPFFTVSASDRTRDGKWDYASWTPGLERMFAPTEPQQNWY